MRRKIRAFYTGQSQYIAHKPRARSVTHFTTSKSLVGISPYGSGCVTPPTGPASGTDRFVEPGTLTIAATCYWPKPSQENRDDVAASYTQAPGVPYQRDRYVRGASGLVSFRPCVVSLWCERNRWYRWKSRCTAADPRALYRDER